MGYSTLICISLLFFTAFSCGSSSEKTTENSDIDSTQQSPMHTDTVDTAKQSKDMNDAFPDIPPPDPAPAPGTLRLRGEMLAIERPDSDKTETTFRFKVLEIQAIGSATPAVVLHDTITVDARTLPDSLKEGSRITAVLTNYPTLELDNSEAESFRWQMVAIKNEQQNDQ